jgi:tripartite ATP-independent transporter DctM subunit
MGWIMIDTKLHPELIPESERALRHVPFRVRLAALKELGPAMFLIICVIGSMYAGIATPTEAAALGVLGAFIVSYVQTGVSWQTLRNVIIGTVQSCSMMGMIILGASLLGNITAALGVPDAVAQVVTSWELSPLMLIVALMMLYLLLGTALEGFAMIACTLPVVLPLVIAAGFDKVWFGIFLVLVVEMAQITPPVAFNLSVLQGITGKSMTYLTRVTLPYLFIMMGFVILIAVFPGIVLWFPNFVLNK